MVKRKTQAKRLTRKLKALREEMRRRWHASRPQQHTWLCQVLRGHYRYYDVIFNSRSLYAFYEGVKRAWFQAFTPSKPEGGHDLATVPPPAGNLLSTKAGDPSSLTQRQSMTASYVSKEPPGAVTPHARDLWGRKPVMDELPDKAASPDL